MKQLTADEGLPYGERTMTFNSRRAQELAAWAVTQPGGEQIHDVLFRAYFVESQNLSQVNVLRAAVESIGLDGVAAVKALESGAYRHVVDADWAESRRLMITGVPTFVAGDRGAVGAQPYEAIERLVKQAGATLRQ